MKVVPPVVLESVAKMCRRLLLLLLQVALLLLVGVLVILIRLVPSKEQGG